MATKKAAKDLRFHDDARERLLRGVDTLTKAVCVTLGPRGRNVVIAAPFGIGSPRITKDGVTVAKEIELRDKFENMGAQMLKEVAIKTSHEAGDGTTTATVLSHALIRGGVKAVAAGLNPMEVKRGIDDAVKVALTDIKVRSKPVSTVDEIVHVGTVSANGDRDIGMLLGQAMEKTGSDGVITLGQARSVDTQLDFVDGMQFDRGYVSPHFVTNQQKMICELEDPYILVHEKKLDQLQALLPLMEVVLKNPKPLLVIADDFGADVLALLVLNNGRGGVQTAAVKAPRFGEQRKGLMEDIAILTGARLLSEERGVSLWNASFDMLGRAKSVRIDKDNTIIIDGAGKKDQIAARTNMLRMQIADMTADYNRQNLRDRLAKLSSGVAVIRVGGTTELELRERRDRVQDALCATRAAMEQGIVAGGGAALLHAGKALSELKPENDEQKAGIDIVRRALRAPAWQIAENCGLDGSIVVSKIFENSDTNQGFNARTGHYVDMLEAGIIDPTAVVRLALQNAASVAGLLLTTEALISP
jgi:chaperonin GroEL